MCREWTEGQADSEYGWLAVAGRAVPTNALQVTIPPGSWSLVAWAPEDATVQPWKVHELHWVNRNDWRLEVELGGSMGEIDYSRTGLTLRMQGEGVRELALTQGLTDLTGRRGSEDAYSRLQEKYSRYRDLLPYRIRAAAVLAFGATLQLLAILVLHFRYRRRLPGVAMSLISGLWVAVAVWMHAVYFV